MIRVLVLLTVAVVPLLAESDFDRLVQRFESQYGVRKQWIPMMGFANFMVKVVRPAGTRDVQLAVFNDIDGGRHPAPQDLDDLVRSGGWKPFIRVVSKRKADRVQIYVRERFKDHELLVTTLEKNDAVVVKVRLNAESLARWVNHPMVMGRSRHGWDSD